VQLPVTTLLVDGLEFVLHCLLDFRINLKPRGAMWEKTENAVRQLQTGIKSAWESLPIDQFSFLEQFWDDFSSIMVMFAVLIIFMSLSVMHLLR
jgi:hypothetical protein